MSTLNQQRPVFNHKGTVRRKGCAAPIPNASVTRRGDLTWPLKRVQIARLRPALLRRALEGSDRKLIVTSSAAVLGDTGNVPLPKRARLRPLPGFAWLARLEKEILHSSGGKGIVIRPAMGDKRQPFRELAHRNRKLAETCQTL
jgi:hypothetical protein